MISYGQAEIILKAIAIMISLIFAMVIKPYLDSKISVQEQEKLKEYICTAVRCAEQIYTPEEWKEKKEYVVKFVLDIMTDKVDLDLSYEQVDTLIEGFVNEVKHNE